MKPLLYFLILIASTITTATVTKTIAVYGVDDENLGPEGERLGSHTGQQARDSHTGDNVIDREFGADRSSQCTISSFDTCIQTNNQR